MRRFIGPITVLLLWAALTVGLNVWFTMNPDNSQTNLIVSIVYMVLLLVIIPVGLIAAFVLRLPVLTVYFLLNLDELIKLPAVYRHYRKHRWVRDLTR